MSSRPEHPFALILDPIRSIEWSYDDEERMLANQGIGLVVPEEDGVVERYLPAADVLVTSGSVQVTSNLIGELSSCVGILCYSSGKDAVDEEAAAAAGIFVENIKATTNEVAEHAMALLLASVRRIVPLANATADRKWDLTLHPEIWTMPRLNGRTLGIVGPGDIGRAIAHRARAFGLATIATYSRQDVPGDPDLPNVDLLSLFGQSDFVVLSAPLKPDTRKMIDSTVLASAKPGLILVNIARGGLIDEKALAAALDDGRIKAAGLDVRDPEPPDPTSDHLTGRPNVIQTPHVGGASDMSRPDVHRLAAERIVYLLQRGGRI